MKVTLAEVARRAEVSASTVTRVLHSNGYVSTENRERVERAMAELGYRPNMLARGLRNSRSYTIGLILSSATDNPFYTQISHSVRSAANAAGLSVLNFNHNYDARAESAGVKRLIDYNVEAVITCHVFDPANLDPVRRAGIPIIEIERQILADAHHVLFDPEPGMAEAVASLARSGRRRIAYLGGRSQAEVLGYMASNTVETQRLDAFRKAAARSGLDPAETLCGLVNYMSADQAEALQGRFGDAPPLAGAARPQAVVCGSDVLAAGVAQAAYELGLRIPGDLALIGYDDSLARFLTPPLDSIVQPYPELGRTVAEFVSRAKTAAKPMSVTLPTRFVRRASTGPSQPQA